MDVILPKVALTMSEATVTKWHAHVGDAIVEGQPLFSMETDKAAVDIDAPASGVLAAILHQAGDVVSAGDLVAIIEPADGGAGPIERNFPRDREVSPAAADLAEMLGLDIGSVIGTGPGGRVLEGDVVSASHRFQSLSGPTFSRSAQLAEPISIPAQMAKGRLAGLTLTARVGGIPTFNMNRTFDFSPVWERMQDKAIGVTDLITIASARALKAVPACHSRLRDNVVHTYLTPRVGILVRFGDALVPLVFEDPSNQSPAEIKRKRVELTADLEGGRLGQEYLWWPTFVVSNLGPFQVHSFTAVLFPETAVTLAIGTLGAGGLPPAALMANLTCDHRIIDGVDAAAFMNELAANILTVAKEGDVKQ